MPVQPSEKSGLELRSIQVLVQRSADLKKHTLLLGAGALAGAQVTAHQEIQALAALQGWILGRLVGGIEFRIGAADVLDAAGLDARRGIGHLVEATDHPQAQPIVVAEAIAVVVVADAQVGQELRPQPHCAAWPR